MTYNFFEFILSSCLKKFVILHYVSFVSNRIAKQTGWFKNLKNLKLNLFKTFVKNSGVLQILLKTLLENLQIYKIVFMTVV